MNKYKWGFLFCFPLFLLYNALVLNGVVRPFLSGYLGVIFPVVLFLVFFLYALEEKSFVFKVSFFVYLFALLLFIYVLFRFSLGSNADVVKGHLAMIFYFSTTFCIFSSIGIRDEVFVKFSFVLYVASLFLILISLPIFRLFFVDFETQVVDFEFSYQFASSAALVTFLYVFLTSKNSALKFCAFLVCFVFILLVGARTELINMIGFLFVYFFFRRPIYSVICFGIIFFVFYAFYIMDTQASIFSHLRIFELLQNGASAGSSNERIRMFKDALQVIEFNPFFGNYGNYAPGEYAHSIINIWSDFGFITFLSLLGFYFTALFYLFGKVIVFSEFERECTFILSLGISLIPVLFFSKGIEYFLFPMFLGLTFNYSRRRCG